MSIGLFDKNLLLLQRSMDLSVKRNAMISSNLANQETPGFRAQDLVFEDQLDRALNSDQPGPLKTTRNS